MRRRHRFLHTLLILTGLGALLYVGISLYVPSSRRMIVGIDKGTGRVRIAEAGITFLPPHQYRRVIFDLREGAATQGGVAVVRSQEGVPVKLTYQLRFSIAEDQMPDARRLVREGWASWIQARVAEAVSALSQRVPVEELVSPSSQFSANRELLQRTVSNHLARSGLQVRSFQIERTEVDREALLALKRSQLRRNARGALGRVAILGLDGADWELIRELIIDGRMPNLDMLIDAGTSGTVQPVQPTVAPLAWTSLATGLTPDRHGVIDFTMGGDRQPITSHARRTPALWDIAEAFGRPAEVVSWWTAWPPTHPDVTAYGLPVGHDSAAIHPESLAPAVAALSIQESTIDFKQMSRFLNITDAEFRSSIASNDPRDPVVALRSVLSKTWSDHRTAIALFEREKPMVTMAFYSGTDVVNHLFGPYHPPLRQGIPYEEYRKYWPTVANYYSEVDRLIGEWVKVLPTDTTLMIVSPYGMTWGRERPAERPSGDSALSEHRRGGIFVAFGNRVQKSNSRRQLNVYDIVPSALAILGLPASSEMPGSVLDWALTDVPAIESVPIVSYSDLVLSRPVAGEARQEPASYLARLGTIGHVADPDRAVATAIQPGDEVAPKVAVGSPQWGTYAHYNNLGVQLMRQGKFAEAVEALERAIALNEGRSTPYLNLAMALLEKQRYTQAEDVFFQAIQHGVGDPVQTIIDFAAWHRSKENHGRAIVVLERGRDLFPQSPEIAANLGSAMASQQRYTDGVAELERALALQPSSTLVLNNLGHIYVRRKDYARALDFWNRSLAIDPSQPKIREGVEAVRTRI